MWIEFITNLSRDCTFTSPATKQDIDATENALNCHFHLDLRAILFESNGIGDEYELGLLWEIEQN